MMLARGLSDNRVSSLLNRLKNDQCVAWHCTSYICSEETRQYDCPTDSRSAFHSVAGKELQEAVQFPSRYRRKLD